MSSEEIEWEMALDMLEGGGGRTGPGPESNCLFNATYEEGGSCCDIVLGFPPKTKLRNN